MKRSLARDYSIMDHDAFDPQLIGSFMLGAGALVFHVFEDHT